MLSVFTFWVACFLAGILTGDIISQGPRFINILCAALAIFVAISLAP